MEGLIRHSRLVIAALSLIVVLAVVVTTTAVYVGRRHAENLAQAGELASESVNTLRTDMALGSLLSVESSRLATTTQTHDAVVNALEQPVDAVLGTGHPVTDVTFSPDNTILAAGTAHDVVLWDRGSGRQIGHHDTHGVPVTNIAFSPDGRILAGAEGNDVVLWETGGRQIGRPIPFAHRVAGVAFRPGPDSEIAVAAGDDVTFWDPVTHTPVGHPLIGSNPVTSVSFRPDGVLATGDTAGTVTLWNASTGIRTGPPVTAGGAPITRLAFSPDDTTLAVVGQGDYIVLVNTATGQQIGKSLPDGNRVTSVAFNPHVAPGTNVLASGTNGGNVVEWTITDSGGPNPNAVFQTLGDGSNVSSVAFSPDGRTLAIGDSAGDATLWNTRTPVDVPVIANRAVTSVAFNPAGTVFATGDSGGAVTLWDRADQVQKGQALSAAGPVSSIAFSPRGALLAAGGGVRSIALWNVTAPSGVRQLPVASRSYSVAFSPDGRMLASGDAGGEVQVWSTVTQMRRGPTLVGHVSVRSVAVGPGDKILAAGNDAGKVVLWNPATATVVGSLTDGSKVNSVAFSPDGALLVSGDDAGNVEVWNVTTRKRVASFDDRSSVYSVAFSPNGATVATGDALGDVIPWDVATGTEVGASLVDPNTIESVAFSPDGRTLASGDDGGDVLLFPASFLSSSTGTIVNQLCGRIRGNLSPGQWSQFLPHTPYQKVCPAYP